MYSPHGQEAKLSKPKRIVEVGVCAYCGEVNEIEDDHVVPQTLFFNVNQAKVTVPACRECNVKKSGGENDLRDYMVISKASFSHPTAQKLRPKVHDAMKKGFSRIGRAAKDAKYEPYYTSSGIYLSHEIIIHIDDPSYMLRTLHYMVRGLYFWELNSHYPENAPHDAIIVPQEEFRSTLLEFRDLAQMNPRNPRILGRSVFAWVPIAPPDSIELIAWVMVFYDSIAVLGFTGTDFSDDDPDSATEPLHRTILKKGRRERKLRDIVKRGLVSPVPDDLTAFIRRALESGQENPRLAAGLLRHDRS